MYRTYQKKRQGHTHSARNSTSLCTCAVADHRELQRLGMITNSEEFGRIARDEVRDSPSSDTSAPSTDADISGLLTITGNSEVSVNINSPENWPSTTNFESEAPAKELQEHEKAKSHTGEDFSVFSSSEISACKSDKPAVCKATEGTESTAPSLKIKQQPSDTKQPNELAVSSDGLDVSDSASEPDDSPKKKDDVQVCVMFVWAYAEGKIREKLLKIDISDISYSTYHKALPKKEPYKYFLDPITGRGARWRSG